MRLTSGTRLGSYEIISPLGSGGMGEVYRARDRKLGRDVALKVLSEEVARDPQRLAGFEREARMAAGLNHPNIVVLHSIEEAGGTRFITMELVEGERLDGHIGQAGLAPDRLIEISIALAEALIAAHEKGIVHRDLKPANVMITRDGRVKVMDFGLAKLATGVVGGADPAQTIESPLTVTGQVVGTVPYMAPEQVRGEPVDARTDLFALGITMYQLATGRRPFRGDTFADLGSSILRDQPERIEKLRQDLPRGFEPIVDRCLEKDASRRFQSAHDLRGELGRVRATMKGVGSDAGGGSPSIAVLPFVNMSRDEENEYFSDGLSEELLNVLAKIPELKVTGRTSSFAFKGKQEDLRDIGHKLGVSTLLEGSVRKAGSRVRITAQLINVADGFHLWTETYDRVLDDIFAVQDDIARSVSQALHVTLLGRSAASPGMSAESFPLVLQANHFAWQNSGPALSRAVVLYQEAIAKDPENARAWAGLALALSYQAGYGHADVHESVREARKAAERALALDNGLAESHTAMGVVLASFEFRFREGLESVRRARALAPGATIPMVLNSFYEGALGDLAEALRLGRRAQEVDPLNPEVHTNRARLESWASNLEAAGEAYQRALELTPNAVAIHSSMGLMFLHRGMGDRALPEIMKEPSAGYRNTALVEAYETLGMKKESDEALARLLTENEQWAFQFALAYTSRGEFDEAFRWLDRSFELRDSGIVMTKVSRRFRLLHGDPRWPRFLEKIGLA